MIGLHIMRPTSIVVAGAGSSASIRSDGGVDFASATSLSLNGVFTADYDNYMISIRSVASSAIQFLNFRFRAAGTDNSTASSYVYQALDVNNTTVQAARYTDDDAAMVFSSSAQRDGAQIFVYGPYLAQPTAMRSIMAFGRNGGEIQDIAATHNQSTSYDGFTWTTSGTTSGMVTVYGYAQ